MKLKELYGSVREAGKRTDLIPDVLGDIDDYTEVELARLYEQVLPYYLSSLETRTSVWKTMRPFSEEPLKLTKLLLGYFELESTNPEDIDRLGVISFTAQELLDLYIRNPQLIGYIKRIEIEDTHLLFDESDPNEILLKPEFAEIFSKMEKLKHLGLDKIFPNSYIEAAYSVDPVFDFSTWMEIVSDVRLPHIRQIFQKIPNYIKSLKIDTSDSTCHQYIEHRDADNFLQEIFRDEKLSNVKAVELISDEKLFLTRDCLRQASFFEGLENLKLFAPRCCFMNERDSGMERESDLILFPNLKYLECSGTRDFSSAWFYIGSEEDYILNIVATKHKYDPERDFDIDSAIIAHPIFYRYQRYDFFIEGERYEGCSVEESSYDLSVETIKDGVLVIELLKDYEALLSNKIIRAIRQYGLRLKFRDIDNLTEKMCFDIIKQISFFGIKIDCITLHAGDIVDQFNNLTDRFKDCLDSDSIIEFMWNAIDIESGVDLSELNETPAQLVLDYWHEIGDPGCYKDWVCPENCDIRINVSEELRKDPTLSLDKMIENTIKSLGKIKYYPYPEIEISGIDVTFDGYESQEIKVVENGDLEEPADLLEVIGKIVEKAGEEYLTHYTSLSLEGFEIKGIGQKFESIKWVELECCDFELEDLEEFLQAFPNLVSISVNECSFSDTEVNEYLKTK